MSNVLETPETPTSITTQAEASELLVQLRTAVQKVRGFELLGKGTRRKLTPSATLPDAFLLSVAAAIEALPGLAAASRITPEKLRDVVAFSNIWGPLVYDLKLLTRGIEDGIAAQRADVGQDALRTYNVAKGFNRPADRELFVPHVASMKTTLGRGPKSGKAKQEPPPPEASPVTALVKVS